MPTLSDIVMGVQEQPRELEANPGPAFRFLICFHARFLRLQCIRDFT